MPYRIDTGDWHTHSRNPWSRLHMPGLLSHLPYEPGNDCDIRIRRKAHGHMAVNAHSYYIGLRRRKKARLFEDDFLERDALTFPSTGSCRTGISGKTDYTESVVCEIIVYLFPAYAKTSAIVLERARLLSCGAQILEILINGGVQATIGTSRITGKGSDVSKFVT